MHTTPQYAPYTGYYIVSEMYTTPWYYSTLGSTICIFDKKTPPTRVLSVICSKHIVPAPPGSHVICIMPSFAISVVDLWIFLIKTILNLIFVFFYAKTCVWMIYRGHLYINILAGALRLRRACSEKKAKCKNVTDRIYLEGV